MIPTCDPAQNRLPRTSRRGGSSFRPHNESFRIIEEGLAGLVDGGVLPAQAVAGRADRPGPELRLERLAATMAGMMRELAGSVDAERHRRARHPSPEDVYALHVLQKVKMGRTRVSPKHQITIPAGVLREAGLR